VWPKEMKEGAKTPATENIHTSMGREYMVAVIQGGALGHVAKMVIAKVPIKAGAMVTCFGDGRGLESTRQSRTRWNDSATVERGR